ncbi:EF-hand domain-containing protein D2 homolog [Drosophila ficusphila]|uniref:EF-hand domain-containing protein D2 homolog n=1 Tax=Drosophila ficusphila TaxID=30025 RepID=UPI0007E62DF5|nr:EF-hand domain-containing protein D2 homolog [Drosophila ficusphila]
MSVAISVRDDFEIPNESQNSVRIDRKIETEKRKEVGDWEKVYKTHQNFKVQTVPDQNLEVAEVIIKSEEVPEYQEEYSEGIELPELREETEITNDVEFSEDNSFEEEEDLFSCSSFTSCCSYKAIRQSILGREQRDASTVCLKSRDFDPEQNQLEEIPPSEADLTHNSSSVKIVMEKKSIRFTPESSDGDYDITLEEVHQQFSSWFKRSEIDAAYSSFQQVDENLDGFIGLGELKRFLEKLEMPQTHLAVKRVMTHVVGKHEERLNFCQALIIHGTLINRLELRKWSLQDREYRRLAMAKAVDVSQVGVSGAKQFFEAKIAMQTEPIASNSAQPMARIPVANSPDSQNTRSKSGQFKSAAAIFKKLESEQ